MKHNEKVHTQKWCPTKVMSQWNATINMTIVIRCLLEWEEQKTNKNQILSVFINSLANFVLFIIVTSKCLGPNTDKHTRTHRLSFLTKIWAKYCADSMTFSLYIHHYGCELMMTIAVCTTACVWADFLLIQYEWSTRRRHTKQATFKFLLNHLIMY